jgi:tetratricopeptide (TPR) repeat protein
MIYDIKKEKFLFMVICLLSCLIVFSCASTKRMAIVDSFSLDEAIEQSTLEIITKLSKGSRVAIIAFLSEHENLSNYIMDELTGALVVGNLEVADRRNLDYVYRELSYQMSGDVSDETAVSIGKFLGAQYVITGQFVKAGDRYRYRLSSINVETAILEVSTRLNVRIDNTLNNFLSDIKQIPVVAGVAYYGGSSNTQQLSTAGTLLDRGIMFYSNNDYETAIVDFTEALKLDPYLTAAYDHRGHVYLANEDYDRAVLDFTQMIRLDPNNDRGYNGRSSAYLGKNDFDRAIVDCTEAIRLDPSNASAYIRRGFAYYGKRDYDRAISDYTQALRIGEGYYNFVYHERGNAYMDKGDLDKAIEDYTQTIRLYPNSADEYYTRGLAYYKKRDYDRAILDYEAALRIDPNHNYSRQALNQARQERDR